jgi:hypothetical protein
MPFREPCPPYRGPNARFPPPQYRIAPPCTPVGRKWHLGASLFPGLVLFRSEFGWFTWFSGPFCPGLLALPGPRPAQHPQQRLRDPELGNGLYHRLLQLLLELRLRARGRARARGDPAPDSSDGHGSALIVSTSVAALLIACCLIAPSADAVAEATWSNAASFACSLCPPAMSARALLPLPQLSPAVPRQAVHCTPAFRVATPPRQPSALANTASLIMLPCCFLLVREHGTGRSGAWVSEGASGRASARGSAGLTRSA